MDFYELPETELREEENEIKMGKYKDKTFNKLKLLQSLLKRESVLKKLCKWYILKSL